MTYKTLLATLALCCAAATTWAQTPLRIITSDQAGGGMDSLIRPMADKLSTLLGRPVLVDNRAGAQGRLAGKAVVDAAPDGNTLLITVQAGVVINPHVYPWPYKSLDDLLPVTDLGRGSMLLLTPASLPVRDFKEFVAWLKAQPKGQVNFGTYSPGTISHFGGLLLGQELGLEMTAVHYKASGDLMKDLVPGVVSFGWNGAAGPVTQLVRGGRLKALAYMGPNRLAVFPDVPTVRELGYPAIESDGWIGVFAPKGTPTETVNRLQADIARVLALPEMRAAYQMFGFEPGGSSSADFARLVRSDFQRWGAYIKKIGYKAE